MYTLLTWLHAWYPLSAPFIFSNVMGVREGSRWNWRLLRCWCGNQKEGVPKKRDKSFVKEEKNLFWERKGRERSCMKHCPCMQRGRKELQKKRSQMFSSCPLTEMAIPLVIAGRMLLVLHRSKGGVSGMEPWKRPRLKIIIGCVWGVGGMLGSARNFKKKKKDMNHISQTNALIVQSFYQELC